MYQVRVAEDYRWSVAIVGGRPFTKHTATEIQEGDMTEEIRTSPLLEVVSISEADVEPDPEPEPEEAEEESGDPD